MRVTLAISLPRDHAGPVTVARCANDVRVGEVNASDIARAVSAAVALASDLDQRADDAIVVHSSNNLALRIVPCDIFARVAPIGHEVARFELEIAQRLAE